MDLILVSTCILIVDVESINNEDVLGKSQSKYDKWEVWRNILHNKVI